MVCLYVNIRWLQDVRNAAEAEIVKPVHKIPTPHPPAHLRQPLICVEAIQEL